MIDSTINIIIKNQKGGKLIMINEYSDILSVEDVMEILNIGKNSAYALFRSKSIKCFQLNGRWKIPKQSLIEFIEERRNSL